MTILVIEDDAETAALVAGALGRAGWSAEIAVSGRDGRRRVAQGGIDLVLLDYRLQDEDGITCLQAMLRHPAPPPVVLMTAFGSEQVAVEAMKSGAADYVVKHGLWLDEACDAVRRAVAGQPAPSDSPPHPPAAPGTAEAIRDQELARWRLEVEADADPARVVRAVQAADEAAARRRHHAVARCYDEAASALDAVARSSERLRAVLTIARAEALWRAGDRLDARGCARAGLDACRRLGDAGLVATASLAYAGRLHGFGAARCEDDVVAVLKEALDALPPGDGPLRALVMARLAEELAVTVADDGRLPLGREAIRMARRLGDPAVVATVIQTTHWALWQPDEADDRLALADEAVALAERLGDATMRLEGELLRVWGLLDAGDFAAADERLEAAAALNASVRQPYYAWLVAMARACLAFAAGRLPAVESLAAEALGLGGQAQNPNAPLFFAAQIGTLYWLAGRDVDVEGALESIVEHSPLLASSVQCARAITCAEAGRMDDARVAFEAAMRDGTWRGIRNITWLPAVAFLADACAALRDVARADELYDALLPFDGRVVTLPPIIVYAPVSHYLGQLAATRGAWEVAGRHFDAAMDLAGRAQSRHWLARTQVAYASMLLDRAHHQDLLLAKALLAAAERTAQDLEMRALLARAAGLRSGLRPPQGDGAAAGRPEAVAVFRCDGEFWTLEFEGQRGLLKDTRGLHYLRRLLECPGGEITAAELAIDGERPLGEPGRRQHGIPAGADAKALADYRRRLRELADEIPEAEAAGRLDDVERLRVESAAIRAAVGASRGLGGRPRLQGDDGDRARIAVKKAIDAAVGRIRQIVPGLAHHLGTHVKTGTCCVYRPHPSRPIVWRTR